eukprot:m.255807 g.255807  ORF g.255807 m.255807 type:complete len:68 (+) comp16184_c0_seq38:3184-3387(+)
MLLTDSEAFGDPAALEFIGVLIGLDEGLKNLLRTTTLEFSPSLGLQQNNQQNALPPYACTQIYRETE